MAGSNKKKYYWKYVTLSIFTYHRVRIHVEIYFLFLASSGFRDAIFDSSIARCARALASTAMFPRIASFFSWDD